MPNEVSDKSELRNGKLTRSEVNGLRRSLRLRCKVVHGILVSKGELLTRNLERRIKEYFKPRDLGNQNSLRGRDKNITDVFLPH